MPAAPSLRIIAHKRGDVTFLRFSGTQIVLDEENAIALRERLDGLVKAGRINLILDLGEVHYMTSTAVETFLHIHRVLKASGGRLSLFNLTPPVAEIFTVLRLDGILDVDAPPDSGVIPSSCS